RRAIRRRRGSSRRSCPRTRHRARPHAAIRRPRPDSPAYSPPCTCRHRAHRRVGTLDAMAAGSGRMRRWFGEFARGFVSLRHGFAFWRVRPGLMALGLVPAVVVAAVFAVLVVLLAINLETITSWMTPFAANWWEWARVAIRVTIGVATLAGALVLVGFAFTAVTVLV